MSKWYTLSFAAFYWWFFSSVAYASHTMLGVNAPFSISMGSLTLGDLDTHTQIGAFCIYSGGMFGAFQIKTSSLHVSGSDYRLKHTSQPSYIRYTVSFEDSTAGFSSMTHNTYLTGQSTGIASDTCTVDNANLKITVAGSEVSGVVSGNYSDTLTLTLSEE